MLKAKIADLIMEYNPYDKEFFTRRFSEYEVKYGTPDLIGVHKVTKKILISEMENVKKSEQTIIGTLENGNRCVYTLLKDGRVFSKFEHNDDYSYNYSEMLSVIPTKESPADNCDREYLRAGNIFKDKLIMSGGTVLHGSCISYKGEGVIFSAPCGTGKSTHAGIWKDVFKDSVTYINDDKPAIRFEKDRAYCYGTPFSGKTELNSNTKAPLKAIVFIKRGEHNKIYNISVAEAVCYLNDQTCPSFYDETLFIKNFECIEKLLKNVKIYTLECNLDPGSAVVAKEKIFG